MESLELDSNTLEALRACCLALDNKKAEDMRIFNLKGHSSITDAVIVATGNSDPHLRALSNVVSGIVKEQSFSLAGIDYEPQSGWVVVDCYQVMVHIMLPEQRDLYQLERMWRNLPEIAVKDLK